MDYQAAIDSFTDGITHAYRRADYSPQTDAYVELYKFGFDLANFIRAEAAKDAAPKYSRFFNQKKNKGIK